MSDRDASWQGIYIMKRDLQDEKIRLMETLGHIRYEGIEVTKQEIYDTEARIQEITEILNKIDTRYYRL